MPAQSYPSGGQPRADRDRTRDERPQDIIPGAKKDAAIVVSYKVSDADWKLTVSDNGGGMADLSAFEKEGGLGTSLIKSLAKQLEAGIETVSNSPRHNGRGPRATFKSKSREAA